MFEALLLTSVVLIVISQLLPEAETMKQNKRSLTAAESGERDKTAKPPKQRMPRNKKQQPCQRVSSGAVISTVPYQFILRS